MYDGDLQVSPPEGASPPGGPPERLKAERVQLALADLPDWKLSGDGGAIVRSFRFSGALAAVLLAALLATLASEAGGYLELAIAQHAVVCSLTTPQTGGVTEEDLELARTISRMGSAGRAGSGLS
jgi:4a-hydroxytetrahydrobiopterin dehydratase